MRNRPLYAVGLLATTLLAGCGTGAPSSDTTTAASSGYPVTVTSCGVTSTITAKPEHAVTLNQGATEVALALGVQDQLAGTAYLDDAVPQKWKAAYDSVKVLAQEYPSHEALLATQPDFVYASYASAFNAKVAGTQAELASQKIGSYLSPFGCENKAERPATTFDAVWDEIDAVATAFGVPQRGQELRTEQQTELDTISAAAAGKGLSVLWYDSGTKTPFVGGNAGGPQLILNAVGATNVFADLDGAWGDGTWEKVIAADPDVIVLADASWDSAADKIAYLEKDPALKKLTAVKERKFVTLPFSESTAGVRLVDGASSVAEQIAKLR
ncbi:ABC transporter substrate-binding protein [Nocardioides sp.]|uniref:ABC transporter substrate-binding protein n=1 Tax=Nocardioides sp. TaxID=35761 RepID=UPI0026175092|nr:ABC transporter substrate-binding protein [Nocardioides sp.]